MTVFEDSCCPCCGDGDDLEVSAHRCGGCYRFVCAACKVDSAGEPSPCHGICKECRERRVDEGIIAIRSLKRIEAELKAGVIGLAELDEVELLARSVLVLTGGPLA